jgi:hypothetical protein
MEEKVNLSVLGLSDNASAGTTYAGGYDPGTNVKPETPKNTTKKVTGVPASQVGSTGDNEYIRGRRRQDEQLLAYEAYQSQKRSGRTTLQWWELAGENKRNADRLVSELQERIKELQVGGDSGRTSGRTAGERWSRDAVPNEIAKLQRDLELALGEQEKARVDLTYAEQYKHQDWYDDLTAGGIGWEETYDETSDAYNKISQQYNEAYKALENAVNGNKYVDILDRNMLDASSIGLSKATSAELGQLEAEVNRLAAQKKILGERLSIAQRQYATGDENAIARGQQRLRSLQAMAQADYNKNLKETISGYTDAASTAGAVVDILEKDQTPFMPTDKWSDDQLKLYLGLLGNGREEEARQYAVDTNRYLNNQSNAEAVKDFEKWGYNEGKTGLGRALAGTVMAVATAPEKMVRFIDKANHVKAQGVYVGDDDVWFSDYADALTGGVSKGLNEQVSFGEKGLGDLYQVGNSMAQSLLYGGGMSKIVGNVIARGATLATFFGSAANDSFDEAIDRGATGEQAVTIGVLAGAAEVLAENMSLENLMNMNKAAARGIARSILSQAGIEGTEEGVTEIMNKLADEFVMGDKSKITQAIQQRMAQGESYESALKAEWKQFAKEVAWSVAAGALSGGVSSAIAYGVDAISPYAADERGNYRYGADAQTLVNEAKQIKDGDRSAVNKAQSKLDKGKSISNAAAKNLTTTVNRSRMVDAVEAQINERASDIDAKTARSLANAVVAKSRNEGLTDNQRKLIEQNSELANALGTELDPKNPAKWASTIGVRGEEARAYGSRDLVNAVEQHEQATLTGGEYAEARADLIEEGQNRVEYTDDFDYVAEVYGNTQNYDNFDEVWDAVKDETVLTQAQVKAAWEAGRNKLTLADNASKLTRRGTGAVSFEAVTDGDVQYEAPNADEIESFKRSARYQYLDTLAKKIGVDIVFFKGGTEGINGKYLDGTVYLAIDASPSVRESVNGYVMLTAAHELTHYIREASPARYAELKDFIIKHIIDKGMVEGKTFKQLIEDKRSAYKRAGVELSVDNAIEEVVADACEMMLKDNTLVAQLKGENATLHGKMSKWLKKFMAKVKEAFTGLEAHHAEAKAMDDVFEELQRIWNLGLTEATQAEVTEQGESDSVKLSRKDDVDNFDAKSSSTTEYRMPKMSLKDDAMTAWLQARDIMQRRNELQRNLEDFKTTEEYNTETDKLFQAVLSGENQEAALAEYREWEERSGYAQMTAEIKRLDEEYNSLFDEYTRLNNEAEQEEKNAAIAKSGLDEDAYYQKQAVKEFGYTPYFYDAGYIVPNGKMLNFSGEKGKHYGMRGQDHRAIGTIYPSNIIGSEAMLKFMGSGNVRIMAETPGIDIAVGVEPTKEQYSTIGKFVNDSISNRYFSVDFTDSKGITVANLEYEGNFSATKVKADIKHYFETGEIRKQSTVQRFMYSLKDDAYMSAVDSGDMETAQRMVDEAAKAAGYTEKVYHGTQRFGFTKLDTSKSDDGISFFATQDLGVAGSYAQQIATDTRKINEKKEALPKRAVPKLRNKLKVLGLEFLHEYTQALGYYDKWHMSQMEYVTENDFSAVVSPKELIDFATSTMDTIASVHANIMDAIDNPVGKKRQLPPVSEETRQKLSELTSEYVIKANTLIAPYQDSGVYGLYANTDNHLVIDAQGGKWNHIRSNDLPAKDGGWTTRDVAQYAKENGYSGVTFKNIIDPANNTVLYPATVYAFFDPQSQVKSADPVTYNMWGKVIPLSERFNKAKPDIRYSIKDEAQSDRMLLANTLMTAAQNDGERRRLNNYKDQMDKFEEIQQKLYTADEELSKAIRTGVKADIDKARRERDGLTQQLIRADSKLLELQATKPLKELLGRVKEDVKGTTAQRGRERAETIRQKETQRRLDAVAKAKAQGAERVTDVRQKETAKRQAAVARERDIKNQRIAEVKQAEKQKRQDAVAKERAKANARIAEEIARRRQAVETLRTEKNARFDAMVAKFQEARRKGIDNRSRTAIRTKIKNLHAQMTTQLLNPKENRYVPKPLLKTVAEILDEINLDSGRSEKLKAKLSELSGMYQQIASSNEYGFAFDPVVDDMVKNLHQMLLGMDDTSIHSMTREELTMVYQTMKAVNHTVRNAVKLVNYETEKNIFEIAKDLMRETGRANPVANKLANKYINATLRPETFFKRMGGYTKNSAWQKMYDMLNEAQRKQTQIQMEGAAIFEDLMRDTKAFDRMTDHKNLIDIGLRD